MRLGYNINSIPAIVGLVSPNYITKYTTKATQKSDKNVVFLAEVLLKNL